MLQYISEDMHTIWLYYDVWLYYELLWIYDLHCPMFVRLTCSLVNTDIFQKQNNTLAPGRYDSNFESIIFKLTKQNSRLSTRCEIDIMWIMQNLSK